MRRGQAVFQTPDMHQRQSTPSSHSFLIFEQATVLAHRGPQVSRTGAMPGRQEIKDGNAVVPTFAPEGAVGIL